MANFSPSSLFSLANPLQIECRSELPMRAQLGQRRSISLAAEAHNQG